MGLALELLTSALPLARPDGPERADERLAFDLGPLTLCAIDIALLDSERTRP